MRQLLHFLLCFFLLSSFIANAQDSTKARKENVLTQKNFFATDEPLEMTLISDFKKLKHQKKGVYLPTTLSFHFADATNIVEDIQVATRGQFRREECDTPPLMLNFKTNASSKLSRLKKMKLVCGCSTTSSDEQLIFKEFLTYKIYNQLTDMSFRVRLVKVNYEDAVNKSKTYTQFGFLIEDVDEMAKRNNCHEYKKQVRGGQFTDRSQ